MRRNSILPLTLTLFLLVFAWGCSEEKTNGVAQPGPEAPPAQPTQVTCLGCHSSESDLKAELAAAPDLAPPLEVRPATSDG